MGESEVGVATFTLPRDDCNMNIQDTGLPSIYIICIFPTDIINIFHLSYLEHMRGSCCHVFKPCPFYQVKYIDMLY